MSDVGVARLATPTGRIGLLKHSYLFSQENTDYINCGYLFYNVPSKMLQEKLGFQEIFTEHFSLDGREIEAVENVLWKTP